MLSLVHNKQRSQLICPVQCLRMADVLDRNANLPFQAAVGYCYTWVGRIGVGKLVSLLGQTVKSVGYIYMCMWCSTNGQMPLEGLTTTAVALSRTASRSSNALLAGAADQQDDMSMWVRESNRLYCVRIINEIWPQYRFDISRSRSCQMTSGDLLRSQSNWNNLILQKSLTLNVERELIEKGWNGGVSGRQGIY